MKKTRHAFFANNAQAIYNNSSHLPNLPFPQKLALSTIPLNLSNKSVLFVGIMSYKPNYLGMDYFLNYIWLNVIKKLPDATIRIVGKGTPKRYQDKWDLIPGVKVLGYVSDLIPEYENCSLVIAPIYRGAGTNIKILEAMYMQRASVVIEFACRGQENVFINHENIMIAKNNDEFVRYIIELLCNYNLNNYIRSNAAKTVSTRFTDNVFYDCVMSALK